MSPGRLPTTPLEAYRRRRERVGERIGEGAALVLWGGELKRRSHDTEYPFRADSDFFYLTGIAEPGAVLVVRAGREPAASLFVRPKDREAEIWSGRRLGPEGATARTGIEAQLLGELAAKLPDLLDGCLDVHAALGRYPGPETALTAAIDLLRARHRRGAVAPQRLHDARVVLGEERLVKDDAALASLRAAVAVTVAGHREAMLRVRPGMPEHELQAIVEYEFRRRGAAGPGYGSIVGGGRNATILHYVDNADDLPADALVLVDAGAEHEHFTGDLTRTYPVSGRFGAAQRDLYQVVLAANLAAIAEVRPGSDVERVHETALRTLCRGLVDLGLLAGEIDGIVEQKSYERFYMHRTSHWLGADVHDAGLYFVDRAPRPLRPGYVLTVEPGLYVHEDDEQAPAALRGTGIRIEDDVLVTEGEPEVLTAAAPKRPEDLEGWVGSGADSA